MNDAYADDIFSHNINDMFLGKPIPTTCCLYKVVGIASPIKVGNIVGIDVVGTESPMPMICRLQRVIKSDFRGKRSFIMYLF